MFGDQGLNVGPMPRAGRARSKAATMRLSLLSPFAAQTTACMESCPTLSLRWNEDPGLHG